MKRTIQGRAYDTEADVELLRAPDDSALRRAEDGQLYLHRQIAQARDEGGWRNATEHEQLTDTVMIVVCPAKVRGRRERRRVLDTIQPVTATQALDWMIWNIVPGELCEALAAREAAR